eukprot:PLAT11868.1.p1 GENE.PLAT11868.1~~PLAT11868.1.p1  ORF type:complete len:451 (+),score=225.38 PLAT11868.1:33-1385(+)
MAESGVTVDRDLRDEPLHDDPAEEGKSADDGHWFMEITVSDPVKQGEGLQAYISYKVNTNTNQKDFKFEQISVIRRYSEFVWLHGQLTSRYPGYIVPPLPEKLIVGRFSPEFVDTRRRLLEKFLNRVAAHTVLRQCDMFREFLESSEAGFASVKEAAAARDRSMSSGIMRWFKDTIDTISGSAPPPDTPEEAAFSDIRSYIDGLEPEMSRVHRHTQALIKRGREMGTGLFEFGLAFSLLGQSESAELGNALAEMGKTADELSKLTTEHAEKEYLFFEEPVKDYISVLGAVKLALDARDRARADYHRETASLASKRDAHNKLVATPSARPDRISAAEEAVVQAQRRVDEAKDKLDNVSDCLLAEVDRFKREKLADFKNMVIDYVQLQIDFNQKVEEHWEALMPTLKAIPAEPAPLPAAGSSIPVTHGAAGGGEEESKLDEKGDDGDDEEAV